MDGISTQSLSPHRYTERHQVCGKLRSKTHTHDVVESRFMNTIRVHFSEVFPTHELRQNIGRAVLPCRLDLKAVRQHSPTRKRFMVTKRVIIFRKGATLEPRERCAAFMPLQCSICEGIRIVRMLLDEPTLKRNKFRDPRIMSSRRTVSRMGAGYESAKLMTRSIGRRCCAAMASGVVRSAKNRFTPL